MNQTTNRFSFTTKDETAESINSFFFQNNMIRLNGPAVSLIQKVSENLQRGSKDRRYYSTDVLGQRYIDNMLIRLGERYLDIEKVADHERAQTILTGLKAVIEDRLSSESSNLLLKNGCGNFFGWFHVDHSTMGPLVAYENVETISLSPLILQNIIQVDFFTTLGPETAIGGSSPLRFMVVV